MLLMKNGALKWCGLHSLLKPACTEPSSIAEASPVASRL